MSTLLLISTLFLASKIQPARANGIIYIRADGSVDPPTPSIQRNGDIYTFAEDIFNTSIVVERSNIILDGNGHTLQEFQTLDYGIYLLLRRNVTITRTVISGFYGGIRLESSDNNKIVSNIVKSGEGYGITLYQSNYNSLIGNTVMNTSEAISLELSSGNTLSGNEVSGNYEGIFLYRGTNNTLRNNVMSANKYNFYVGVHWLSCYLHDIDTSNTVDGKPIYYWINHHDETVPLNAGFVAVVNSSKITVENLVLKNSWSIVTFAYTTNSIIQNVTVTESGAGMDLNHCSLNVITGNTVTGSFGAGIGLTLSNNNTVSYNVVTNTTGCGIWLEDTYGNNVIGNNVAYTQSGGGAQEFNGAGILVDDSPRTRVIDNTLTQNRYGITVGAFQSSNNLIIGNNIIASQIGLILFEGINNILYHNNFIESEIKHVNTYYGTTNTLDNGYPSGGNYWSDYTGWDANNDEIGDVPYVIDENNRDRYPLMSPYGSPPLPKYTLTIAATTGGATSPSLGNYTHSKGQNIPIQATPESGYILNHWELDSVNIGASNPINVTMNSNHHVLALFNVPTYNITIKAHCNAESTDVGVSIIMDGLPTGRTTPYTFTDLIGTHTFTVPIIDAKGHPFKQWDTGQNSTTITVNSDATYTATYDMQYNLTITCTLGGTTNPDPATYSYWSGTILSITATADSGYYLDYWLLDGFNIGAPDSIKVGMKENHTLHAAFKQLSSEHDVAIKYIDSKTVVGQSYPLTVKVKAVNVGGYAENFNVTAFVNDTAFGLQEIHLESGASAIITFTWNSSSFAKGNYTLIAIAEPISGETQLADNTFTDAWVIVAMIGDVTGPAGWPDRKVDMRDVFEVARTFGINSVHLLWNPNCDFNDDGKVDMRDVYVVARNFGKTDL